MTAAIAPERHLNPLTLPNHVRHVRVRQDVEDKGVVDAAATKRRRSSSDGRATWLMATGLW